MVFTPRFWVLIAIGGLLALLGLRYPPILLLVAIWDIGVIFLALLDLFTLPRPAAFQVRRLHEEVLSLGAANLIRLEVLVHTRRPLKLRLRDEPPSECLFDQREFRLTLLPYQPAECRYHLTPIRRGDHRFQDIFLRVEGALGLVIGTYRLPAREVVKVYPDLLAIRQYDLLRHRGMLRQVGFRQVRLRGAGTQFESLREYTPDDEFRRIDWKATARKNKLIVRDYETERSQNVILMLDAGRNMLAEVEGLRKFDTVLNVALMLAYVAMLMDDKVGAMVFSDEIEQFIPPQRGKQQVARLTEALHAQEARPVEPDYLGAVTYFAHRWRKRSLIAVFTDLVEVEASRALVQALSGIARHHLCLCITVADPRLRRLSQQAPETLPQFYSRAIATQVLTDRFAVIRMLEHMGVHVIDTEPENLVQAVVNYYTQVKGKGRL